MSIFYPEKLGLTPSKQPKTAVLLINLGSPDSPTTADVRRYLRAFLSDRRVVDLPRFLWLPILYGLVLTLRAPRTAKLYRAIWQEDGAPLLHYSKQQATALEAALVRTQTPIYLAMTYGNPSIKDAIFAMKNAGIRRIVVLPLFPQYASSSTGAALDAVWQVLRKTRYQPEITTINEFYDHPHYIEAMAAHIRQQNIDFEKYLLILSYHSTPQSHYDGGDPYYDQCHISARLLAQALGLKEDRYRVCFQSRFGHDPWLKPATQTVLPQLAAENHRYIAIFCPNFVSECLETLEEIALSAHQLFLHAGGEDFRYIACLNDHEGLIATLKDVIEPYL